MKILKTELEKRIVLAAKVPGPGRKVITEMCQSWNETAKRDDGKPIVDPVSCIIRMWKDKICLLINILALVATCVVVSVFLAYVVSGGTITKPEAFYFVGAGAIAGFIFGCSRTVVEWPRRSSNWETANALDFLMAIRTVEQWVEEDFESFPSNTLLIVRDHLNMWAKNVHELKHSPFDWYKKEGERTFQDWKETLTLMRRLFSLYEVKLSADPKDYFPQGEVPAEDASANNDKSPQSSGTSKINRAKPSVDLLDTCLHDEF